MIFSSVEFIFIFLPITALLFALMRKYVTVAAALGVLTVASIVFYGVWRPQDIPLLLGSIIVNWLLALTIKGPSADALPAAKRTHDYLFLTIGIVLNVGLLFWFKYAVFASTVATQAGLLNHPLAKKVLPLGISFFTFVQIAYLVDRYKGLAPLASFWRYVLFVCFFPHLIAGPIVHHASMMPQLERPRPSSQTFALALFIFAVGFAKKTLLADPLGEIADAGFDSHAIHSLAVVNAWFVVFAYTLQLYFDFSGYSDMAIGLALMFGVQFPWNFLSPYKSTSIGQFWRNWHITLSNFLRDYVYIPLGGSRVTKTRNAINLLLTMLIGGIWHGAGWTYILWGSLHGGALVVNHRWSTAKKAMPAILAWTLTTSTVIAGWVLFRAATIQDAGTMYATLLGRSPAIFKFDGELVTAFPYMLIAILLALSAPNTRQLSIRFKPNLMWAFGTAALMCVSMVFILGKVHAPEFLYYEF